MGEDLLFVLPIIKFILSFAYTQAAFYSLAHHAGYLLLSFMLFGPVQRFRHEVIV